MLFNDPKTKNIAIVILIIAVIALALLNAMTYLGETKHFANIKVVFFNGGDEGDAFASIVHQGAVDAGKDLGCEVEHVWSGWDEKKMVAQLREAIDKRPDAIAIMGHPGEEALKPLVSEAIRKGIVVTSQNVDLPSIREEFGQDGFGYVGQDTYASGTILGNGAVKKLGLKAGDEAAIIAPQLDTDGVWPSARALRAKGVIDSLEKAGIVVHKVQMPSEVNANANDGGQELIQKILTDYPKTILLVTDHGAFTAATGEFLKNIGKQPGEIKVAGFDLSKPTVDSIKEGYVSIVLDQQPYLQGYLPVLQACITKKYDFSGLYIDTGSGLIDKTNIDLVDKLVAEKIR